MNRMTTTTARKPTQRAFDDWRTTWAARSGDSSTERVAGGEVKRSTGAVSTGGRGTGRRCSGSSSEPEPFSGVSVIEPGPSGATSDASRRRTRRDESRLAERDRQWSEGYLAGVDCQHAGRVDRDREAVHAARRGPELRAIGLDPEAVVARAVTRTLEPEVLEAWVRLAAEMWAALVQGPHVERLAVAGRVLARAEPLLSRVVQDDEGARLGVVGREALLDRQRAVLQLDGVEIADGDGGPEAPFEVRPREGQGAGKDLEGPQSDSRAERQPHELSAGQPLDLLLAQRLDRLLGQGGGLVDQFDLVVAHERGVLRKVITGRSAGRGS